MNKSKVISFVWQHIWLLISLFIMTFGVALCVRSELGSSVISSIPYVMTQAGSENLAPALTIGTYTNIMNMLLVVCQIAVLRRKFQKVQLFQLLVGFVFGFFLDINMAISAPIPVSELWQQIAAQVVGCTVLAVGIAMEIRCGSITMPGEGMPVAICKITGAPFPKVKIMVDISLVVIAVILGFIYFGRWMWNVVGFGTLFAMIYVGAAVRFVDPHMLWFERVLRYVPGFRRYVYGLMRFIVHKN